MTVWNIVFVLSLVVVCLLDSVHGHYNRSFIPSDFNQTVDLDVHFSSPGISFSSCCSTYNYPARELRINTTTPIVKAADVRSEVVPTVTLQHVYDSSESFNESLYSLICVDPDVPFPTAGTEDDPYLHWMVVNIPNGDVMNGTTVSSYFGPAPPNFEDHYYYFMLYKQMSDLDPDKMRNYTNPVDGRFLFNISAFVEDNNLHLVGIIYMISNTDEYVRYNYVTLQSRDPAEFCANIEGYAVPCTTSGAPSRFTNFAFAIVFASLLRMSIL